MGVDYDAYSVRDKKVLELLRRDMGLISAAAKDDVEVTDAFGYKDFVQKVTKSQLEAELTEWKAEDSDPDYDGGIHNAEVLLDWMEEELEEDFVLIQASYNSLVGPWKM